MTALALLKSTIVERKSPRYIFRRRAVMTSGSITIHVKTLDVSEHGFGVVAPEPVTIGKTCTLVLNGLVGDRIIQQTFSCEIIYCILASVDGFRIGLSIHQAVADSPKQRLQKIIDNCSPSFFKTLVVDTHVTRYAVVHDLLASCDNIRFVYVSYIIHINGSIMGIVKITEQMHTNLRLTSGAMSRSINSQAEHWLRVGMVAEMNPGLCYSDICQKLIEAEQQAVEASHEITLSVDKP